MFFRTVTSILDSRRNSKDFRGFLLTIFHVFFTTLCHIPSVIAVEMYVVTITTFRHRLLSVVVVQENTPDELGWWQLTTGYE